MATRGRKSKILDDEIRKRFLQGIRMGATYELCCAYAGISYQTYLNWKTAAEQEKDAVFVEFFEDVTRAEGEAAIRWLATLEKHSDVDPKWAAWKLERRYPKEYGRTVHEHKIDDWRSQAIEDIKAGRILYKELAQAFDDDLATTLFREAGISVSAR